MVFWHPKVEILQESAAEVINGMGVNGCHWIRVIFRLAWVLIEFLNSY